MEALFKTLPALLKQLPDVPEVRRAVVFAAWKRVAGAQLVQRAAAHSLDGRVLGVAVRDKNWQRQLQDLAPQLLFKLNAMLEDSVIDRIEFIIAPEAFADIAKDPANEDTAAAPADIERSAAAISDPSLRKAVVRAAAESLAHKKRYGR